MAKNVIMAVGEQYFQHEGLIAEVEEWEDGFRTLDKKGCFEWWYIDCHLDDGSTCVVVFSTKALLNRKGPLKPSVMVTYTTASGEVFRSFDIYPEKDFSAKTDYCDVTIGKNNFTGNLSSYQLKVHLTTGIELNLILNAVVPAWRPGAGINYYDTDLSQFFGWLAAIPYGRVQGTVAINGTHTKVTGNCYHDHNWGNVSLNKVMSHWYWGRAHVGDYTAIFVEMNALPAYGSTKIPIFMLAKGNTILTGDGEPLKLELEDFVNHTGGRCYPQKLKFDWDSGNEKITLQLKTANIIEATSLLGMLPSWQQKIARLIANPYYFRFSSDIEIDIKMNELRDAVNGNALFEIMMLT